MNAFKIKRKKEIHRLPIIRVIICFLCTVGALLVICIWTGAKLLTFKHVFIISVCSIPLCVLYAFAVEKLGSGVGGMLTGWTSKKIDLREQLSADLEIARHSKRSGRFEESLSIINDVLNKDPDFPDALYLKAEILWEGFGRSSESKKCFRRIMQLVSADKPLYRWSSNYYDEITAKEKMRLTDLRSHDGR